MPVQSKICNLHESGAASMSNAEMNVENEAAVFERSRQTRV